MAANDANWETANEPGNPLAKSRNDRMARWFVLSAGAILAITGAAKLLSTGGHVKILYVNDPIFGIPFGILLRVVAFIELTIAALCFFARNRTNVALVAWFGGSSMLYRICLWWTGWTRPCSCLGSLTDAIPIPPEMADWIAKILLTYLFVGAFFFLIREIILNRRATHSFKAAVQHKHSLLLLEFALLLSFLAPSNAANFMATGEVTCEYFGPDGAAFQKLNSKFEVRRADAKWAINHFPKDSPTFVNVMFDGADVYCITRDMVVDEKTVRRFPNAKTRFQLRGGVFYGSSAQISAGDHPYAAPEVPRLLWYVFLSGSFLRTNPTAEIPAPWGNSSHPDSRSFKLQIHWSGVESEFPDEIRFLGSEELWMKATQEQLGPRRGDRPTFSDESIGGFCSVTGWRHLNGQTNVRVPSEFSLVRYYPPSQGSNLVIAERWNGRLATLAPMDDEISTPQLSESELDMFDLRFRDARYPLLTVTYQIADHTWKATNDPSLKPSVELSRAQYDEVRTNAAVLGKGSKAFRSPGERFIIRAIFFCLALALPAALGLFWLRGRFAQDGEIQQQNK